MQVELIIQATHGEIFERETFAFRLEQFCKLAYSLIPPFHNRQKNV
jgi:hypothetical protein